AFWQEVLSITVKPDVRTVLSEEVGHVVDGLLFHDWRTILGIENWEWHTPNPLPGNYPVATVLDHVTQPRLPPGRLVVNFFQRVKDVLAHLVDGNEPLVGRPEDDWFLSPPVKWVGVL